MPKNIPKTGKRYRPKTSVKGKRYLCAKDRAEQLGHELLNSDTAYDNDGTFLAPYDDPLIGRVGVAAFTMGTTAAYSQNVLQNDLGPIG